MPNNNFKNIALHFDTRERLIAYATKHNLQLSHAIEKAITESEFFNELYDTEVIPILREAKDG